MALVFVLRLAALTVCVEVGKERGGGEICDRTKSFPQRASEKRSRGPVFFAARTQGWASTDVYRELKDEK